ncbi:MAG: hypothetical protein Q9165_001265 [Trypethelium subeluteriae]
MLVCAKWHALIDQVVDWHTIDLTPWFYRYYMSKGLNRTNASSTMNISDLLNERATQQRAAQQRIVNARRLQLQSPCSGRDRVSQTKSDVSAETQIPIPGYLLWTVFSIKQRNVRYKTAELHLECPNLEVIRAALDFVADRYAHDQHCVNRLVPVLGDFDEIAPNLTELDLSDSRLCSYRDLIGHCLFPTCRNLRILRLDRAYEPFYSGDDRPLEYRGVWQWIISCAKLEVLSLIDTIFEEQDLRCLLCIEELHLLKELDLSWTGHSGSRPMADQSLAYLGSHCHSRMKRMMKCPNAEHQACNDTDLFVAPEAGGGLALSEPYKVKLILRGQSASLDPAQEEIRRSLDSIQRVFKVIGLTAE